MILVRDIYVRIDVNLVFIDVGSGACDGENACATIGLYSGLTGITVPDGECVGPNACNLCGAFGCDVVDFTVTAASCAG